MISTISSVRGPRESKSSPSHWNSWGIHDRPTPSAMRSGPASAEIDPTVFATSNGWRMGSFSTMVRNRTRSVTAAMAGMATNGSRNGVSPVQ